MREGQKKTLPMLDIKTGINHSPHVIILGAGASRACCPSGDKNGKSLPVMADLIRALGIEELISKIGLDPNDNFESLYSEIHRRQLSDELRLIDESVRKYFQSIEIQNSPTLYDYLVLSLRPKDLIITFNWDPLLIQAFKRWRHLGEVLPKLAFLHGNVDLAVNVKKKSCKFLSDVVAADESFAQTQLLYPIEKKNYNSDPFVKDQWDLALKHLNYAYYVTVYGYSAPKTDVEARSLLLKAWQKNTTQTLAEFDVIDIRDDDEIKGNWSEFITDTHGGISTNFDHNILKMHPRRSCEAFAFATLQQAPWHDDPFPQDATLQQLEEWISPLLIEEAGGRLNGKPLH